MAAFFCTYQDLNARGVGSQVSLYRFHGLFYQLAAPFATARLPSSLIQRTLLTLHARSAIIKTIYLSLRRVALGEFVFVEEGTAQAMDDGDSSNTAHKWNYIITWRKT